MDRTPLPPSLREVAERSEVGGSVVRWIVPGCSFRLLIPSDDRTPFLKYHMAQMQYMDETHLKAWLLRVAINRARDITAAFWRKNRVSWEEYMDELEFAQPEDRSLFQSVMSLPEKYRLVLHLYYYEECSIKEIASLLHTGEGTIKSRLSRGRALLKTILTEDLEP